MEETVIEVKLEALARSMETGFQRVHTDIGELKADMKVINSVGIERRLDKLEKWRDGLSTRLWAFMVGGAVAVLAAWSSVLFERSN
jgi:hypothetical protein